MDVECRYWLYLIAYPHLKLPHRRRHASALNSTARHQGDGANKFKWDGINVSSAALPSRRIALSPHRPLAASPPCPLAASPSRRIALSPHRRPAHMPSPSTALPSTRSLALSRFTPASRRALAIPLFAHPPSVPLLCRRPTHLPDPASSVRFPYPSRPDCTLPPPPVLPGNLAPGNDPGFPPSIRNRKGGPKPPFPEIRGNPRTVQMQALRGASLTS
jgi:hypothetical protein